MRPTLESIKNAGLVSADYIVQMKQRLLIFACILAASIPLMWLINIAGFRELNLIGFFLGGVVILVVAFRPEALLAAMGIGAVAGWLENRDASQGVLRGVQALHKIAVGALFAFWGAAGLLAVHPWHQSPGAFWAILASILVVVSILQLYDIKATALRVSVVVGYTAVVCGYALWSTVPATWQGRMFDARTGAPLAMMEPDGSRVYHDRRPADCVRGCFSEFSGKRLVPVTPDVAARSGIRGVRGEDRSTLEQQNETEIVPAGASGTTIAPTRRWSEWRKFGGVGYCFRVWTGNPTGDDISVRYVNRSGEIWGWNGGYISNVEAMSFRSKIGSPVKVYYETWPKVTNRSCHKA